MITRYDYFYDQQFKRYLMQVVRAVSGFSYMTGSRAGNPPQQLMVPVQTAKRNKQAAAIQQNMSENMVLGVPMMTVDIIDIALDRPNIQNQNHVDIIQMTEREVDAVTGEYTGRRGNSMTVERLMPTPWIMTMQIDLWTSNMEQKMQLIEQISRVIAPSFDIQNSDNALDWTALTTATMEDFKYSSLSIPIGAGSENEIDVATWTLKIPMWLTSPAIVSRQNLIQQVMTNISDATRDDDGVIIQSADLINIVTTPGDYHIEMSRGFLTLLGPTATKHDPEGALYQWDELFHTYKVLLHPSETRITLRQTIGDDTSGDIVGTVQPTDQPNVLMWQADIATLPSNTMPSITAIIDPNRSVPGDGALAEPTEGQRYLLHDDLAGPSMAWGNVTARTGSIIQYQNGAWVVTFNSVGHDRQEYIVNSMTGRQLRWDIQEQSWIIAIDGTYGPGLWRLGTI